MAGKEQNNIWPLPKFHFEVEIGGDVLAAQSVEGMDMEVSTIEYRHGNMSQYHKLKMPGLASYSNVSIKKAVFKGDMNLWKWIKKAESGLLSRQSVKIKMLDADGEKVLLAWQLHNAFPVKFAAADLNAEDDGEPAIEELEIAYEYFSKI